MYLRLAIRVSEYVKYTHILIKSFYAFFKLHILFKHCVFIVIIILTNFEFKLSKECISFCDFYYECLIWVQHV